MKLWAAGVETPEVGGREDDGATASREPGVIVESWGGCPRGHLRGEQRRLTGNIPRICSKTACWMRVQWVPPFRSADRLSTGVTPETVWEHLNFSFLGDRCQARHLKGQHWQQFEQQQLSCSAATRKESWAMKPRCCKIGRRWQQVQNSRKQALLDLFEGSGDAQVINRACSDATSLRLRDQEGVIPTNCKCKNLLTNIAWAKKSIWKHIEDAADKASANCAKIYNDLVKCFSFVNEQEEKLASNEQLMNYEAKLSQW